MQILSVGSKETLVQVPIEKAAAGGIPIQCCMEQAVRIVQQYNLEEEHPFLLTDSWTREPTTRNMVYLLHRGKVGDPLMGRMLERTVDAEFYPSLLKHISFAMAGFGSVRRVFGRKNGRDGFEHFIGTLRMASGAVVQIEWMQTNYLEPVWEFDISGSEGNMQYRSEPAQSFLWEKASGSLSREGENKQLHYNETQRITARELKGLDDIGAMLIQSCSRNEVQEVEVQG
ncbi:hypothetical protein ACFFGV_17385 [Pontibacillus salicampi]|uniref:Uncharacterized protein n=1 Tax=Pontibacillus salicampi TaxID=1449801 RepID=A0ABV6LSX1_9BACI